MTLSKKKFSLSLILLFSALALAVLYIFLDVMAGNLPINSYGFRLNLCYSIISVFPVVMTLTFVIMERLLHNLNPRIYLLIIFLFKLFLPVILDFTGTDDLNVMYFCSTAENYSFTLITAYILIIVLVVALTIASRGILRVYSVFSALICAGSAVFYFCSESCSTFCIVKETLAICVDLLFLASLFILSDYLKENNELAFMMKFGNLIFPSLQGSEQNNSASDDADNIFEKILDDDCTEESSVTKPYCGTKKYIFVSYAHKDYHIVLPIIKRMIKEGYRVWFDKGIDPFTEWDENIATHIDNCGYFAAFISDNYLSSDNCKDELNYARDLDKDRLVIYIEKTALPSGIAMRINRIQSVFMYEYSNEEEFYDKLFSTKNIESCRS